MSSEHLADTAPVSEKVDVSGAATTAAEKRDSSPIEHLLVFTPFIIIALLASIILRYSATRLDNQDTWFHLSLGSHFSTDWSLSHPGALTPFATSSWVPTQWSTEVVATWVESRWGLPGVAWLFGAAYFALVLATYVVCRRKSRMLPAAAVTVLVVFASASTLSARPQVVSLVLVAVTVHAWLSTWDDGRLRWWLVPMTWVWATAHGLWSAGVLLGLVGVPSGSCSTVGSAGADGPAAFAVPVLSLVCCLRSRPVGPRLLTSQLAVGARTSLIPEWGPTSFRSPCLRWSRADGGVTRRPLGAPGRCRVDPLLLLLWPAVGAAGDTDGAVRCDPGRPAVLAQRSATVSCRGGPARPVAARSGWPWVWSRLAYLGHPRRRRTPHGRTSPAACRPRCSHASRRLPPGRRRARRGRDRRDGSSGRSPVYPVIDGMLDAYPVDYIRQFSDFKKVAPGWPDFVEPVWRDVRRPSRRVSGLGCSAGPAGVDRGSEGSGVGLPDGTRLDRDPTPGDDLQHPARRPARPAAARGGPGGRTGRAAGQREPEDGPCGGAATAGTSPTAGTSGTSQAAVPPGRTCWRSRRASA